MPTYCELYIAYNMKISTQKKKKKSFHIPIMEFFLKENENSNFFWNNPTITELYMTSFWLRRKIDHNAQNCLKKYYNSTQIPFWVEIWLSLNGPNSLIRIGIQILKTWGCCVPAYAQVL